MKRNGFDMPDGRAGAEKCRQKFANLQRSYLSYIKHKKTTGTEKRDPPLYFEEMHAILGMKDKVSPQCLEDSLDISSCSVDLSDEATPSSSSSDGNSNKQKEIKNRFTSHSSVRPSTNFNKMMDLFKDQHEQLRQDRATHMKVFEDAIKIQNEQRQSFLDTLLRIEKQGRKSNKRSHSSSSDD